MRVTLLKKKIFFIKNGNKRINSTSKIKNIKAIEKNWIEKGVRIIILGLNPHSKGLDFSKIKFRFFLVKRVKNSRTKEIKKQMGIII